MQCLKISTPPLLGGQGQIEYLAWLIIGLEHPIPDPNPHLTTENVAAWVIKMILFNSGLNLYDSQGGLGDYIDCYKFLYPQFFGKQLFFQVFLPEEI